MSNLTDRDIRLWLVADRKVSDAALLRRYHGLLSSDEKARHARIADIAQGQQFLVSRALLREVLAAELDCDPRQLNFTQAPGGKPELAGIRPGDIRFNLSHTRGLTALLVCRGHEPGLDLEYLQRRPAVLKLARRYFSDSELGYLQAEPEQLHERFLELWTLKEAWFKARGLGIGAGMKALAFGLDEEHIRLAAIPCDHGKARRWSGWQFPVGEEHLAALVVHSGFAAMPLRLECRQGQPLLAYEPFLPERQRYGQGSMLKPELPAAIP